MDTEKPYTIETEDRGDYLWALVGGEKLTAEIAADYWNQIAAKCRQTDCQRVMIEKDFKVPVGPEDLIQMASHVASILPACRIAYLDRWHHDSVNELGK